MTMSDRFDGADDVAPVPHPDLGGFVLGNLTDDEEALFQADLARDPALRREVDDLAGLPHLLGLAALVDDENEVAVPSRVVSLPPPKPLRTRRVGSLLAAAAAVFALLGGVAFIANRTVDGPDRQVALGVVAGTPSSNARGTAALSRVGAGVGVRLKLSGLEPTDPDTRYECWWIGRNGKVSAGSFRVGPSGNADVRMNVAASLDGPFRINVNKVNGATETRVLTAEIT
jgi:hypothetical protein